MKSLLVFLIAWLQCSSLLAAVVTHDVDYMVDGQAMRGYLAYDDVVKGKRPAVLVVHEWWGLNDYAKSRARQLAEMGYVAFAADMYGKGKVTRDKKEAGDWSGHLRSSPLLRKRARAALDLLKGRADVDKSKVAAIGFCFGGTTILELAYDGADLAGVVTFHGGLTAPGPDDIERIKARFLVLHGADDGFVKPDAITAFRQGLDLAGADWQIIEYGGTVHSFSNPEADGYGIPGVAYNRKAAERSWRQMQDFFSEIFQ